MNRDGYRFYKGPPDPHKNGLAVDGRELNGGSDQMAGNGKVKNNKWDESKSVASLDSTGKQKSFTRLITRFAEKTSMQGVPYINNAKLIWAKVIWSVLLLIAIGMMCLHLWYLCNQFFGFPKITKVSLGFDNLEFPRITLCNTNTMHKGRFEQMQGAEALKQLVEDLEPHNLVPDQFNPDYDPTAPVDGNGAGGAGTGPTGPPGTAPPTPGTGGTGTGATVRKKRFIEETDNVNISKYDPDWVDRDDERDFKENEFDGQEAKGTVIQETFTSLYMDLNKKNRTYLGHQIDDMLMSCTFGGRTCKPNMFRLHQSSEYGNCWTIESKQFRVSTSGPAGGMSLTLYLESTEYLEGITNGYGIRLLVHEPHTFPFPEQEGHHISASFETNVGLKLVSINRESPPYGNCDPDIASSFKEQFNLTYTRRACQTVCELEAMVAECGCFDHKTEQLSQRKDPQLRPCRGPKERQCKFNKNIQIARKEISCNCPVPCSEIAYEKYFSSRQWPSDNYAMVLLQGVCEKDPVVCKLIRDKKDNRATNYNFLKLNIYYEDLNFEEITEQPEIELAQFLSDVGGAVGLWIGLSILSMCEVIQLFVELCDYAKHKSCRSGRENRKRQVRHRHRRHSDSEAHSRSRDENGHATKITDRQWPHTQYNGWGNRDSHRPPRDRPDIVDGRFKDLYGDYSDKHYPHTVLP